MVERDWFLVFLGYLRRSLSYERMHVCKGFEKDVECGHNRAWTYGEVAHDELPAC